MGFDDGVLPRKRVAATVLFFDAGGRVLLVEPAYKTEWELPGGVVEIDESPYAAACREVEEELGRTGPVGRLLAVDWSPPRPGRTESIVMVFDGGVLPPDEIAALRVPADELRGVAWCTPDDAAQRLPPVLARRLASSCAARAAGEVAYLENGDPRRFS
jgi:8-oxo-dGTP pyrophosphatase MutT (NUDIX family)